MRFSTHHRHLSFAFGALVATALLLHSDSSAQSVSSSTAQCCLQTTSAVESYLNPAVGEDLRFFSSDARPASVVMTMMNRKEMLSFPMSLYEIRERANAPSGTAYTDPDDASATGCNNALLQSLTYFFPRETTLAGTYRPQPQRTYPPPEYTYGLVNQSNFQNHYQPSKFYRHMTWSQKCQNSNDCSPLDTAVDACNGLTLATDEQRLACQACLTTKGFYINPNISAKTDTDRALYDPKAAAFSGNWLNFYPPRYVLMRLAMKRLTAHPDISRFRIGVVGADGTDGGKVIDALRPSCNGQGTPSQSLASGADALDFTSTRNPIGETLFNVGQYISRSGRYSELFSSSAVLKTGMNEGNGETRSICRDCDKMFVVLFSDGRGDEGNKYCTRRADGTLPLPCIKEAKCGDLGLGEESDGDKYIKPDIAAPLYVGGPRTPTNTCASDYADDVAWWLQRTDLNPDSGYPSKNNVTTYVVGVGSTRYNRMESLRAIANAGEGKFISATNYDALEQGLNDVLADISRRATSFSSASVSPLQVSNGATAFLPRFRPSNRATWTGYLYRWGIYNEWVENTDKNGDGDKSDVFLVDNTAQKNIVVEDAEGNFVLASDNTARAEPYWEAGQLVADAGSAARKIWTVIDNAAPWNQLDSSDSLVEFKVSNAATLLPYLGLTGTSVCSLLSQKLGLATPLTELDCAKKVIAYVRGVDVLDEDGDSDFTEDRSWILGDVFHSSPVVVEPPPDKFACELGLSTQCARTLYAQDLQTTPTPLVSYTDTNGNAVDAYEQYRTTWKGRRRLVLVGANDGMVHAFHAGDVIDPPPQVSVDNPFPDTHTMGTGQEVWAFIPPDLLPKLKSMLTEHQYYVDGDTMVREVWKDKDTGTANKKDADEFMTVAVFSERRGGTHYFSLDITDTSLDHPRAFLWLFPQPCSTESLEVGETWMTLSPRPPPIGPVLFKKTGGIERTINGTSYDTEERWLVFLQGGYDPNLNRGQGVYALDVVSGKLVYKNTFDASDDLRKYMKYPFAAPVAAVDFGAGTSITSVQDGFFDTAVVGDIGGQVHVLRFLEPAEDTNDDGRVDNWLMARAFENDASYTTDDEADATSNLAAGLRTRHPFFFLPAATVQADTGALRIFMGSGDRYNLRDVDAGVCRADNPNACAKYGCEWQSDLVLDAGGSRVTTHLHMDNQKVKHFTRSVTTGTSAACTSFSARQTDRLNTCPGSLNPGVIKDRELLCSTTVGTYACTTPNTTFINTAQNNTSFSTSGLGINRYYGIWAYGGIGPANSTRPLRFASRDEAVTFDTGRLRDASLQDVTAVTADASGNITGGTPASPTGSGWYYQYASYGERTASGSALLAGCTMWNSLKYVGTTNTCALGGDNDARLFQGHYLTGAPTCAAAFAGTRSQTRSVMAPPPELAATVAISKTGQISQSIQSFDPGTNATSAQVNTVEDPLQLIYGVDVPRDLHECRHTDATKCK